METTNCRKAKLKYGCVLSSKRPHELPHLITDATAWAIRLSGEVDVWCTFYTYTVPAIFPSIIHNRYGYHRTILMHAWNYSSRRDLLRAVRSHLPILSRTDRGLLRWVICSAPSNFGYLGYCLSIRREDAI